MSKYNFPESFKVGDVISLCDGAWQLLFPQIFALYRQRGPIRDVGRIKVLEIKNDKYVLALMDVAREEGRVCVPVNTTTQADLRTIHLSLALHYKRLKEQEEIPDDEEE